MRKTQRGAISLFSESEGDVLEHITRYRMTTNEILEARCFPELTSNAVTKITANLCRGGYLERHPLSGGQDYFVLSRKTAKLLGVSARRSEPLGLQALPFHYGVLLYCCLGEVPRERLTAEELREKYGLTSVADRAAAYCEDGDRLVLLRVDLGGSADHVARKCREDFRRRMEDPNWRELIDAGRFRIIIITGISEKAAAIRQALARFKGNVSFRTAVIADLLPLLS